VIRLYNNKYYIKLDHWIKTYIIYAPLTLYEYFYFKIKIRFYLSQLGVWFVEYLEDYYICIINFT
jgi:hypothetical protein